MVVNDICFSTTYSVSHSKEKLKKITKEKQAGFNVRRRRLRCLSTLTDTGLHLKRKKTILQSCAHALHFDSCV